MAILSFTKDNRIDDFTFVLVRKDNANIGSIHGRDVDYKHNFNSPDELSLKVYKDLDSNYNTYWDRINDYNDIYVPELGDDGYFEMEVTLSEDSTGVYKNITATSRCESELSHTKIYNYEINTEDEMLYDEDWNKYLVTLLYRDVSSFETQIEAWEEELENLPEDDPQREVLINSIAEAQDEIKRYKHYSILHRLLDKLPNYSLGHIDQTLVELTDWYQFSWDDQDVYSILTGDLSEQYHILFKFNSKDRIISVYDLYSVCQNDNCSYRIMMHEDRDITTRFRGDFHHTCPECGSNNITSGYGKFTKIKISKDNLTNSAQVSSNKDSLINCFKISGGDDNIDAAVMNLNPNGSAYFYQFSEENLIEMPPELVELIENYNDEYNAWYYGDEENNKGIYTFDADDVSKFNTEIIDYVKTEDRFKEEDVKQFVNLKEKYIGYRSLGSVYYNILDLEEFFENSMLSVPDTNKESLEKTIAKLTADNISPLSVPNPVSASIDSVNSAVLQTVKCIINTALYEATIVDNTEYSPTWTPATSTKGSGTWKGKIKLVTIETKDTVDEDENTAITNELSIAVDGDMNNYVIKRIEIMTARKDEMLVPLTDITDKELDYIKEHESTSSSLEAEYAERLKAYNLNYLAKIVRPCYEDALAIIEQNSNKIQELFREFYKNRLALIDEEISERKAQLNLILNIKNQIEKYRDATKRALNFANYLGDDWYKVFCDYRREDTYKNDNYISDDLDNNDIMRRASELIDFAQKELYKASHLQYDVSGDLNNLLALPEFTSIKDDFEVGNWIKMFVDENMYDLRLLSYSINFGDIQNISVEFSTVEKVWSGASDVQSILQAAGSIAGSYSNTQEQMKNYQTSNKTVNDWVDNGLDATQTKFVNDAVSQEITYDSTGFYARGYDEVTQTYTPQQLKIVKNGLYLTEDNWETLSTGIGAFTYYDIDDKEYHDTYGVIANTVVGKLILGENLKIYNENATFIMNEDGLSINDEDGNSVFNADTKGNLSLTGEVIATTLTATNTGIIGPWTFNSTYFRNGNITSATNTSVSGVYLGKDGLNISGGTAATTAYITKNGVNIGDKLKWDGSTLSVAGNITASSGSIGGWTIGNEKGTNEKDGSLYYGTFGSSGSIYLIPKGVTSAKKIGNHSGSDWVLTAGANFGVTKTGALYASGATISGAVTATTLTATNTGTIGPWAFSSTALYRSSADYGASNGIYFGTKGLSISNNFQVDTDGYITLKANSGSTGMNISTGSGGQHSQYGPDFVYIGDSSTERIDFRADGIYYQGGISGPTVNSDRYLAISFSSLRINKGTGEYPIISVRGYDNTLRTPVGSSSTAEYQCYGIGCRSNGELRVVGAWGESGKSSTYIFSGSSSDERLKKNIQSSNVNALDIINQLNPVSFDWKTNNKHVDLGFIAQDLEKISSSLVIPPDENLTVEGAMKYYTVNSYYLECVTAKAVQEQQVQINKLNQQIVDLQNTIKELKGE